MYRCQQCNTQVKSGQPQLKLVTEQREKIYFNKVEDEMPKKSKGWEIVKEISVCSNCNVDFIGTTPAGKQILAALSKAVTMAERGVL